MQSNFVSSNTMDRLNCIFSPLNFAVNSLSNKLHLHQFIVN